LSRESGLIPKSWAQGFVFRGEELGMIKESTGKNTEAGRFQSRLMEEMRKTVFLTDKVGRMRRPRDISFAKSRPYRYNTVS